MIELRVAATDADLEEWRRVRLAVEPDDRCPTVEELRRAAPPGSLHLVAGPEGSPAGSGVTGPSRLGGAFVLPRVVPDERRRGVGTALLRALAEHAAAVGHTEVFAPASGDGSAAFAAHFGFEEVGRQVEQVRVLVPDEPWPALPAGVELVRIADAPELFARAYDELAGEVFADVPTPREVHVTREDWLSDWPAWPEASFVALEAGAVVGYAALEPGAGARARHGLTAVRRDRRGRGLGAALKQAEAHAASRLGVRELVSWTQGANRAMQALNGSLGYRDAGALVTMHRSLPL